MGLPEVIRERAKAVDDDYFLLHGLLEGSSPHPYLYGVGRVFPWGGNLRKHWLDAHRRSIGAFHSICVVEEQSYGGGKGVGGADINPPLRESPAKQTLVIGFSQAKPEPKVTQTQSQGGGRGENTIIRVLGS